MQLDPSHWLLTELNETCYGCQDENFPTLSEVTER
jgi:hypothetical protein